MILKDWQPWSVELWEENPSKAHPIMEMAEAATTVGFRPKRWAVKPEISPPKIWPRATTDAKTIVLSVKTVIVLSLYRTYGCQSIWGNFFFEVFLKLRQHDSANSKSKSNIQLAQIQHRNRKYLGKCKKRTKFQFRSCNLSRFLTWRAVDNADIIEWKSMSN